MLAQKILPKCFVKPIWMSALLGAVLMSPNGTEARKTPDCYCAGEAYDQNWIHDRGTITTLTDGSTPPTCDRCRILCLDKTLAAFAWGNCWGQSIKKSNCNGC